MREGNALKY